MQAETKWNPKVIAARVATGMLPERTLHSLRKHYYAYILKNRLGVGERDRSLVGHLVSTGDAVVDIGASIGGYTRYLSEKVGGRGHVYSFEPNPSTFDFLSHNVEVLKLANVELFNFALSLGIGVSLRCQAGWPYRGRMEESDGKKSHPRFRAGESNDLVYQV